MKANREIRLSSKGYDNGNTNQYQNETEWSQGCSQNEADVSRILPIPLNKIVRLAPFSAEFIGFNWHSFGRSGMKDMEPEIWKEKKSTWAKHEKKSVRLLTLEWLLRIDVIVSELSSATPTIPESDVYARCVEDITIFK